MLNAIISFSVRQKLIITLFTFSLVLWGIYEATRLPIDAVPDITDNQAQIITISPALGAPDVERLITFPIEQANSNIPGIKKIRSFSRFGLSLVTIVFEDEVDIYWARQQIAERLLKVQNDLPNGVGNPELAPVTTGLGEIYQYVVRAEKGYEQKYSLTELRTIQDWIIRRQLLGVKGVADVSSFGGALKQYEVSINPSQLQANGISINEVFDALNSNNSNTGGAYIERGDGILYIRSEGLLKTFADIENIVVKTNSSGTPLRIRDVAKVQFAEAVRYGAMCYNADGEVAGAIVMMLKGANSSEVIDNVKSRIEEIRKTLPEGIVLEAFLDRSKMVNNAIGTVEKNLMEGALIVIFVLVLFLGNLRAGLIVASVIPLSMLFAIIMMNLFGVSGNLMSLGAIDFGLIVDGAVIIVEAIMHQLSHSKRFVNITRLSQSEMNEEVNSSASKMMNSAVFGQIIILVVYLPIFSLQGIEGKMFSPMAATVAFALVGAFILSLTYVPMMSSLFISKKIKHEPNISDRVMIGLEKKYQHALEFVLNHKRKSLALVLAIFLFSIFILTKMGGEFIPELEEGDFAVDTRVLTGSNLNTTIEGTQATAKILLDKFPEVEKVVTKIGSGEIPTDPMPIEASDMMVILKDKSEWTSAETYDELAEKMSAELAAVPGLTVGFQYPVQMRFNELMTGARQDVVCKIFGEDLDTLALYAHKLGEIIKTVDGAKDLYVEAIGGMPQIVIQYKREALAQYGITVDEINNTVNAAYAGAVSGKIYEGEKQFDLVVRMDKNFKNDIESLENLLVSRTNGSSVPLNLLATINSIDGPNQIQREDAKRRIIIGFNVRGKDVQTIVTELKTKVDKQIKLPAGYYTVYGGSFENLVAATNRLAVAVPLSLLLILLMLYFAFGSLKQSVLIFSAIPLSAIGGIFALSLRSLPFSISAGIGFIALFGVAVLNGIVLIAEFNRLRKEGWHDARQIVIHGTKIRLRPVLMTAAVASMGFIPMALSNGAGAEVQRPLATVVIGGLLTATLLTLFILPVLYKMFSNFKPNKKASTTIITSIILLLISSNTFAQNSISWADARTKMLDQNLLLKANENYQTTVQKSKGLGVDIPKTELSVQSGQYNSGDQDRAYSIMQSFHFPTYYVNNAKYANAQKDIVKAEKELKKQELLADLHFQYYCIQLFSEKENYLADIQAQLKNVENSIDLLFEKGQLNRMEKSMLDNALINIQKEKSLNTAVLNAHVQKFNWLLSANNQYNKVEGTAFYESTEMYTADKTSYFIQRLMAENEMQKNAWKTERARLLPDVRIGYTNQSLTGIVYDGRISSTSDRFQFVNAGISIPIFYQSQHAKNKIAKASWEKSLAQLNFEKDKNALEKQRLQAICKEEKILLLKYKNSILPEMKLALSSSIQQLEKGSITYAEWAMYINQVISTYEVYQGLYMQSLQDFTELLMVNCEL